MSNRPLLVEQALASPMSAKYLRLDVDIINPECDAFHSTKPVSEC